MKNSSVSQAKNKKPQKKRVLFVDAKTGKSVMKDAE